MSGLECKNISKSYKDNKVLDNVSLNIEQGKIYGLIGRNGVGKTTLMSIMTGQNPADSGEVTYNGQPVWENAEALSHICFSREINTKSLLGMNNQKVKEYLRLASIYYKNWDKDMAEELVKRFGIDKKKKVCNLSKGMLSMLTVIIGLASKAEITILDEPAAGLDVIVREEFYKLIIDEQQENGRTFIISTHIIEEAANVFEEVIILKDKCVYLKENTVELLDKCRYVSGLEENVKNAVDGCKIMARRIEAATGIETRATILGYMQRGGSPTCKDRMYASIMGSYAVDLLVAGKSNRLVAYKDGRFVDYDIDEALAMTKDISDYEFNISAMLSN